MKKHETNGSKRITAKNIAKELGISVMTVSRAMNNMPNVNEKTRKKVIETARRLSYSPNHVAKSLVLKKTQTIGVVVPEITHSFFPEAIRGIEEVIYDFGYHLILTHSAEDAKRELDAIMTLESKRVDGILISMAQTVTDHKIYRHIIKSGLPIVFFDRCVTGIGANCVSINDEESARKITIHLIEHGYDHLAHLAGPKEVSIGNSRLNGFLRACSENGIRQGNIVVIESGFHEQHGYNSTKRMLEICSKKLPRGIVAVNDPAAFGAMKALAEAGLSVPDDIAIVGFSDDVRANLLPVPLTTVRQPAYEVGKKAAQKLFSLIGGISNGIEEIVIETEQVIRRSCGCPYPT